MIIMSNSSVPTKIIGIKSNFSSIRSLSPPSRINTEKLQPLNLVQMYSSQKQLKPCQSIEIDSPNLFQKSSHLPLLMQTKNNLNEKDIILNKEYTKVVRSDSNLNDNQKNIPLRNIDANTSTLQKGYSSRKIIVGSKFQDSPKSIFTHQPSIPLLPMKTISQTQLESQEIQQNQGGEFLYPIDMQLEKYMLIFYKLQNLTTEKRNNYNFVNLLLKILNILLQMETNKIKNDYQKIKQDILDQIQSLFICQQEEFYQQIEYKHIEFKQLSYMQICQRLNKQIQIVINSKNSEQEQIEQKELKSLYEQKEIEQLKQQIELNFESEEIIKMKRVIQKQSIQKNELNKEISELQAKIKQQSDIIDTLKQQIQSNEKKNNEKNVKEKMELKQAIYNLELKQEDLIKQNEEFTTNQELISNFTHELLKIIKSLNQTIQTYEMDYVYKKQIETMANREKFDLIYQTKQQIPQLKQTIRKLLDLQIEKY